MLQLRNLLGWDNKSLRFSWLVEGGDTRLLAKRQRFCGRGVTRVVKHGRSWGRRMTRRFAGWRGVLWVIALVGFVGEVRGVAAEPSAAAVAAFNAYIGTVEGRLGRQHAGAKGFLVPVAAESEAGLRRGELVVEKVVPGGGGELPGAMIYHWRGTAFAQGAKAADFERLMRDFDGYVRHFAPQVMAAKTLAHDGDHYQASMRVRQKHVITVVMDTSYDVNFGRLDATHGYSVSRSMRTAEIGGAGTSDEHVLTASEEHGFLWRLDTYWSYEERDGGLYMQIESVSLTRSIPVGLGWAIGPFVESVPRESLEFTLRSVCDAVRP